MSVKKQESEGYWTGPIEVIIATGGEDPAARGPKAKPRFSSAHLFGKFSSEGSSNVKVRAALKVRSEKDR